METELNMWNEEYEQMSSFEKTEFRRIANYLLSHTYINRYKYQPSENMTLPNKDYQFVTRFFRLLEEYFAVSGWRLECDDIYGVMSLINIYDNNRYRLDQFTTLFLYTCRLIYEEKRESASSFHSVLTSTNEIVQKMTILGLLKSGKTTQKERLEAQRALAHYNLIEKREAAAWDPNGNELLILPSILTVISNQGINDLMNEYDQEGAGGELDADGQPDEGGQRGEDGQPVEDSQSDADSQPGESDQSDVDGRPIEDDQEGPA